MITILTGDNSFEIERELRRMIGGFLGSVERIDGGELERRQLPDLLTATTLFDEHRLVIIKQLSEQKALWNELVDWLPRLSDATELVLVEPKPDKRTKTYKALQKLSDVREFKPWTDRDQQQALQWLQTESASLDCALDNASASLLLRRVGLDQWSLYQALQKLAVLDLVTPGEIERVIEPTRVENVFELFEAALRGDRTKISQMIATLSLSEDPYRLFGLLSGQAFQLAVLATSDEPSTVVAKQLGVHPYAMSKLASSARSLGRSGAKTIIAAFNEADSAMKTSVAEPWLLIERALQKVARV